MEGTAVTDILLDTGCTCTMVQRDLVPGEAVMVLCPHGDTTLYIPTSEDHYRCGGIQDGGDGSSVGDFTRLSPAGD